MFKTRKLKKGEKLSLTNDGHLSLFFVGVGSAFSKIHHQTNLLVIKGQDHILIDCGTLGPQGLWDVGCPVQNIDNFIITHSHADHIGGMEEAALMGRYATKKRPKLYVTDEYRDILWENSLKGGISFNEIHNGKNLELNDIFEVISPKKIESAMRPMWEANIGCINVKWFRTKHMPDTAKSWEDSFLSYGVVIDDKVLFTSDTRFDNELIDVIGKKYNIQTYFHDCQFFTGGVHCSFDELKQYPLEIRKKIVLSHYGDNFQDFDPKKDGFIGFAKECTYYDFS